MKKTFWLITLLLFLFPSIANSVVTKNDIGLSAKKTCGKLYFCYKGLITSIYLPKFKSEIWYSSKDRDVYYLFSDVEKPTKFSKINFRHKFFGSYNNKFGGSLVSFHRNLDEAKLSADPIMKKKLNEQKKLAKEKEKKQKKLVKQKQKQSVANDKIAQSKQICKDLGFKVNSEKFADCALKMMTIQFEATNKVASGSGTKQEIIVKHKQDYDIWDAMLDMSNALSGSSSNNNSSSSGSSGTRCVIQKTHAWGHTVMNCN